MFVKLFFGFFIEALNQEPGRECQAIGSILTGAEPMCIRVAPISLIGARAKQHARARCFMPPIISEGFFGAASASPIFYSQYVAAFRRLSGGIWRERKKSMLFRAPAQNGSWGVVAAPVV